MSVIELSIGPGPVPGRFRVEVLRSPAGEAMTMADLDVKALLAQRAELQQAILASSVPTRTVLPEEQRVRDVGGALFRALLGTGEVAGRYRAAAAVAAERGEGLRVVLRIGDPALAGLPWEAMYDEAAGAYVCRRTQLVRHVGVPSAAAPLAVAPPLRILGVVSSPRGLPALDVDKEQDQLARALAPVTAGGLAELAWAPSPAWADLQDVLLGDRWHVVHFIGHGDFDPDRDEGVLALAGGDGRMDLVEASRLVDLLRQAHPVPRLVVLNSCSGAVPGIADLFSGTAAALVRGGVSAVAAMQYEISDQAASAFARGFYGAIARGRGVDEAVSSGRVAIIGLSGRTLEWVTPVLYLRGEDSHLFKVPTQRTTTEHEVQRAKAGLSIPHRPVMTLTGHTGQVLSVAFSPDGSLVASAGLDATVRLWRTATGTEIRTLTRHASSAPSVAFFPHPVAFSPDGTMIASSDGSSVVLWDVASGTRLRTLSAPAGLTGRPAFSPDGTLLACAGADNRVHLWDPASGTPLSRSPDHGYQFVRDAAFSPDGRQLASGGDLGMVRLWDTATWSRGIVIKAHFERVDRVAFSPDGALLATAKSGSIGSVRLWETGMWQQVCEVDCHDTTGMAFSPDGTLLATAGPHGRVQLWKTADGTRACALDRGTWANDVAFSPDGSVLASACWDGTVRLWG
jgi:hypothetical protein